MVDIRPHRRLAVLFRPPRFNDLVDVSDFVSVMYEHVGVASFGSEMFAYTSTAVLRRMFSSVGMKLLVDCSDASNASLSAAEGADFVTTPVSLVNSVTAVCSGRSRVLVRVVDDMDLEFVRVSAADGVYCDASFVARAKSSLPAGLVIFASGGDVVQAVKAGADFATVGDPVLTAKDPARAARSLAEEFREFT
jgi:hypothetical protein